MNMEVGALQQMLSRFRQMQEDLQRQVNAVTVEASAGGGMVTVKMNGQKQIVDLRIEPEVFASKDQEMLQDLVRAAMDRAGHPALLMVDAVSSLASTDYRHDEWLSLIHI